ncbi:MAG: hypothetical protein ABI645_09010 [Pseudomonadota bacterium]
MSRSRLLPIAIAIPTALGLIGFAYFQRHMGGLGVPRIAFYISAAVICALPTVVKWLRHKPCCAA